MCSYDEEELVFFSVCLKLPRGLEEKLVASQQNVTGLQKMNCYKLGQLENGEKALLYFDMTSNDTLNYMWTYRVEISS